MRCWTAATFFVVALLVVPVAARAQSPDRFEARLVYQSDGRPVVGASVSIVGETGSARTNEEGRFTWSPVPPTPFQLIVILPGGQVARPVLIEQLAATTTDIPIAAIADEAITVLGVAPSVETAPASATTVLTATQIAQRSPETLMQALETVPGISQVSEGHAAVPAVRGMARGRTLFLIDGGRVTAERRVGPSATFLDPSSVEGIDIARGPGSVAYGSDAIGGVISVRTRRAEPGTPLQTRATVSFGVGVPEARGSFELAKGLARGGVLIQAHVRNAEDYDSPGGEVFNSGWEDRGVLAHFTHALGDGFLSAAWQSDFGRDVERPRNNSRAVRFFYPYEDSHRFTSNYELSDVAGFRQIALTAFLGAYRQRTDQDRAATATQGRDLERSDLAANDFHVKANAERLAGPARVEFGVDVNGRYGLEAFDIIQAFDPAGTATRDEAHVSIENARRADTGAYVQTEAAVTDNVRASAGIRADRVTTSNRGGFFGSRSTTNTAPSGFGAITVGPIRGFSVSLQLARAFRDPSLSDRYFRGPTGRGFITGNPDLKPETSVQYDLAARYSRPTTQLAVYYYAYKLSDLIERYQTDIDVFLFRNRGRARVRGFEIEATSQLGRGYSIELAAQVARGEAVDDDESLDDISPESVSLLGRKDFNEQIYVQSRLALYAQDDRPGPSETSMPGATLLDVSAGWKIRPQFELRGQVRNLLDEAHYASPDPRWVLAPGRSASVTAVVQF